jgi:hypothetical protein
LLRATNFVFRKPQIRYRWSDLNSRVLHDSTNRISFTFGLRMHSYGEYRTDPGRAANFFDFTNTAFSFSLATLQTIKNRHGVHKGNGVGG